MSFCQVCQAPLNKSIQKTINGVRYKSCPKCSSNDGKHHIFYKYDEYYGFTEKRETENNPEGVQSYCSRCRGGNFGPHKPNIKCK